MEKLIELKNLTKNYGKFPALRDLSDELSGVVRLGVALWRGASLLPDVFPSYHEKYPNVRLQLEEGPGSQMTQALENDRIDFAVMNLPHTLDYTRFVCRTLCEERNIDFLIFIDVIYSIMYQNVMRKLAVTDCKVRDLFIYRLSFEVILIYQNTERVI